MHLITKMGYILLTIYHYYIMLTLWCYTSRRTNFLAKNTDCNKPLLHTDVIRVIINFTATHVLEVSIAQIEKGQQIT